MSDRTGNEIQRATDAQMSAIDKVVQECSPLKTAELGVMKRAFMLAQGIQQLREMITDDMMAEIYPLMNSSLGFRTDRDPKQKDWKTGQFHEAYGIDVVKDCLIETLMRGLFPVGNEWNIISERPYTTKEGYTRLLRDYPGLSDLKLVPSVPRIHPSGEGAIVTYKATWMLNRTSDSLEREFAVKVNKGMGTDAILGKAERKMKHAIYGKITGSEHLLPDGDVDDARTVVATVVATGPSEANDRLRDALTRGTAVQQTQATEETTETKVEPVVQENKAETQNENPFAELADPEKFVNAMFIHAPTGTARNALVSALQAAAKSAKKKLADTSIEWRGGLVEAAKEGRFDWKLGVVKN